MELGLRRYCSILEDETESAGNGEWQKELLGLGRHLGKADGTSSDVRRPCASLREGSPYSDSMEPGDRSFGSTGHLGSGTQWGDW